MYLAVGGVGISLGFAFRTRGLCGSYEYYIDNRSSQTFLCGAGGMKKTESTPTTCLLLLQSVLQKNKKGDLVLNIVHGMRRSNVDAVQSTSAEHSKAK